MKYLRHAMLIGIGVMLMFVSHEIYRLIRPASLEYDNWLGYSSTGDYHSLRITGSPGKVHEEIIESIGSGNSSIYRLAFNAYNSPCKIRAMYPMDTLSGDVLIQVDGPGAMKYSDSQKGRMITLTNESEEENKQYVSMYYDFDNNGTLDCIYTKAKVVDSEVLITVGKKLVSVDKVPENPEIGTVKTSDGTATYRFVEGYWQAL